MLPLKTRRVRHSTDWDEWRRLGGKRDQIRREIREERRLDLQQQDTERLLNILGVTGGKLPNDLKYIESHGVYIDERSQGTSKQLLGSPLFKNWLLSNRSWPLVVSGNSDTYATARCSPLSLLDVALTAQINSMPQAQALYFFCGLHTRSDDEYAGPVGLLRTLIAQLLLWDWDYDLRVVWQSYPPDMLRSGNPDFLSVLLRALLAQKLESDTVFCIIDGPQHFEGSPLWHHQMESVMLNLYKLTFDPDIKVSFKLLVTTAGVSRIANSTIPGSYHIWITEDGGSGGGAEAEGVLNDREFEFEFSRRPYPERREYYPPRSYDTFRSAENKYSEGFE